MSNIWILLKNNLRIQIIKKPVSFIIFLLAPIIVMFLVIKMLFGSPGFFTVGVIDYDKTEVSSVIIKEMKEIEFINIKEIKEEDISSGFAENSLNGVMKIRDGLQESIIDGKINKIDIIVKENESDIKDLITSILEGKINNILKIAKVAQGSEKEFLNLLSELREENIISLQKKSLSDIQEDFTATHIFLGFLIFFMLLRGSAYNKHYYNEKRENIYSRFFVAPIKEYEYYIADFLSCIFIIVIQILIGILGVRLLDLNIGFALDELFVICLAVGITSVALSICLRAFFKSEGAYDLIFTFVIMVLVMVGGCFIPIDMLPETIDKISYFTPVRWAMEAMFDLQQGMGMRSAIFDIIKVLSFAVLFLVIAIYKAEYGEKAFKN